LLPVDWPTSSLLQLEYNRCKSFHFYRNPLVRSNIHPQGRSRCCLDSMLLHWGQNYLNYLGNSTIRALRSSHWDSRYRHLWRNNRFRRRNIQEHLEEFDQFISSFEAKQGLLTSSLLKNVTAVKGFQCAKQMIFWNLCKFFSDHGRCKQKPCAERNEILNELSFHDDWNALKRIRCDSSWKD
jgi:hypothetical protein